MLRIHFMQQCPECAGMEDALYEIESMRRFARLDLGDDALGRRCRGGEGLPRLRGGLTRGLRAMIRRRSVIEPTIGHMKADGKLNRNGLKGALGDAMHAVLCGAGHNLRIILRKVGLFYALILLALRGFKTLLNGRPRKNLGWKTPQEALAIDMADYVKHEILETANPLIG